MNFLKERQQALAGLMKEKGVKALILSPAMNLLYVTGFNTFPGERLLVGILEDSGKLTFVVPKLYEQEVREKAGFDGLLSWDDSENPEELLRKVLPAAVSGKHTYAIEDTMWFTAFEKINRAAGGSGFIRASELVGQLRKYKKEDEAEKMRRASALTEEALGQLIGMIRPGMRELDIKELLEGEMRKRGLSAPSFDTIIGSGPNSALPHYTAGERVVGDGDSIVIDFGGVYEGYCSDMTRTVFIGEPSEEYRKVYEIVREANRRAAAAVKPGAKAAEVDFAARSYIAEQGYGEYFTHRTGHGIGLEVHEEPYISNISGAVLEPGMVFSIEPGIYIPGRFGVRIEDLAMVTGDGVELLNKFDKGLIRL